MDFRALISRKISLLHVYILLAVLLFFLTGLIFFEGNNSVTKMGLLFAIYGFGLVLWADAFSLSFEGFRRYDRYGISRERPVRNKVLSIMGVVSPFFFLAIGPLALIFSNILMGYSHYASPDAAKPKNIYNMYWFSAVFLGIDSLLLSAAVLLADMKGTA